MLNITFFVKKDCNPCDEAREHLSALQSKFPHKLIEIDIETDEAIAAKYNDIVPVIEVGPYSIEGPVTRQKLEMTIGAASDRKNQLEQVDDLGYKTRIKKGQTVNTGDKISYWISRRYLLLLNLFMFLYVGLPFLAPTLLKVGAEGPANVIYRIYKPLCHQFGFRSFFLYGEQIVYPAESAGVAGLQTFEDATGILHVDDPYSPTRFDARNYTGNETVGYKVALCERDIAIYLAILAFGIIFGLTGRRMKSVHWLIWVLLGLGPIGLDGFSQLFSQFNWDWLSSIVPYRESTPTLRVLTGAFFGFMTAWFAYPNVEESMNETRQYYVKKFAVNQVSE